MKCIYNGKLVLKDQILIDKAVIYDKKIIDIVDEKYVNNNIEKINAKGNYISPGFIDIHIHGYAGFDTMDAEYEKLKIISKRLIENGVTAFLPTTMTMDFKDIYKALDAIKLLKNNTNNEGAKVLGAHMEGPFISKKFKGAQNDNYIISPDFELIKDYLDVIKIITLAPELEGATAFIDEVKKNSDILLSIGHSSADFNSAYIGIKHGMSHVTHFFNAMTGLHHREPGIVGAALSKDITIEFIADNIHVHPSLYNVLLNAKGKDKIILITDCISAGGINEGECLLGGQKVNVKDGEARLIDGTLAGSVLKMNEALLNMKNNTNLNVNEIVNLASYNPAKLINVHDTKGSIDIGKDADIVIFDEGLSIYNTVVGGQIVWIK